jgi:DNA-directed RNA polymerase specialized sigma24 family protein
MQALAGDRASKAKGERMGRDMDEEVREVLDKIEALSESDDPAVEAKKLTDLLKAWPSTYSAVRARRQDAVKKLSGAGMTHRQIAELLDISYGRVGQIIAGETASHTKKTKKAEEKSAE